MPQVEFHETVRERISRWRLAKEFREGAIGYAEALSEAGLPVIFEFDHLAHQLEIRRDVLADMVNRTEGFYHEFKIPKRRGGFREISVPSPSLLEAQRWILSNILEQIELHSNSFGFRKCKSIMDNAKVHLGCRYLLKMDLEDFFPSISIKRVIKIFLRAGYAPNVSYFLAKICCHREKLPQGAATSPYLSNIIAKRLDARLFGLCQLKDWVYSRYADDIAISGNWISPRVVNIVREIAESEGFKTNDSKTILVKGKGKKIVTGLSVAGTKLCLPREYKRALRKEVHFLESVRKVHEG